MNNKTLDITIGFSWSILLLLVIWATDNYVVRILVGTPLVLFLTGHSVLRAIRPTKTGILEHVVYSIGVSVAVCVAGGFLLNKLSLLNPSGWGILLIVVNGAAAVLAARHPYEPFVIPRPPRIRPWQAAGLAAAVALTTGGYVLAASEINSFRQFYYTEFWLLPKANPGKLIVGIKNLEQEPQEFNLVVTAGKNMIASWPSIKLDPGRDWINEVAVGLDNTRAEAKLYRTSDHALYRKVSSFVPGAKPDANTATNTVLPPNNRR